MIELSGEIPIIRPTTYTTRGIQISVYPEYALSRSIPIHSRLNLPEFINGTKYTSNSVNIPGTFIRRDGWREDYSPIIYDGRLQFIRKKIRSHYPIHDWERAAIKIGANRQLSNLQRAKQTIHGANTDITIGEAHEILNVSYKGPKNEISKTVKQEAKKNALESVQILSINNLSILPVVCSELISIPPEVLVETDLIAETAYNSPKWKRRYQKLISKGEISPGTKVIRRDGVLERESGVFEIDGSIERIEY